MKKIVALAAAPLVFLSLCTSISAQAQAAAPAASTLYCWKDKLYPAGSDLVCNWSDNTRDACEGSQMSNVNKDAIKGEPAKVKRCNNGEWLVQVTKK